MTARPDMHAGNADVTRKRHSAVPACFVGACVIALVIALVPMGVQCTEGGLHVHRCEAHAVTPGNLGAKLLTKVAEAAGLPEGQLIATTAGVIAASTGMNLANSDGIEMGATAAHNLGALIDAADYPAWDTLDSETQEAWGNKYDYDAAKYCELLTGLGYGDLVTEFYSSGGGNFDPSDDEAERLQQLGRIGDNWANGASNLMGEVRDAFFSSNAVYAWMYGKEPAYAFDASSISEWPEDVPRNLVINNGTKLVIAYGSNRANYYVYASSDDVYYLLFQYGDHGLYLKTFSLGTYKYGWNTSSNGEPNVNVSTDAYKATGHNGVVYYRSTMSSAYGYKSGIWNMSYNIVNSVPADSSINKAIEIMLERGVEAERLVPDITDYPEEGEDGEQAIPDDTPIYYPADGKPGTDGQPGEPGGINPDTTWPEFVTPPPEPETPRPENPFNPADPEDPGNQSGTPEWNQETEENITPLVNIHFEKLFPFCLIYDIQLFWQKLQSILGDGSGGLRAQAVENYETIVIPPLDVPGWGGEEWVIDLSWLRQLLNLTRPAVFWLVLIWMIMSVVDFWRGILTGGH